MAAKKIALFTSGKDERPMVKIPAGEFLYGEDEEKKETKEFFIDQHHIRPCYVFAQRQVFLNFMKSHIIYYARRILLPISYSLLQCSV